MIAMTARLHADEFDIDAALVRRLLATQLPGWAHLPLSRIASSGTDNVLFRLGTDLVVRLPRVPGAAAQIVKGGRWLPVLAPLLPVAIPEPVALGAPDGGYPAPWAVLRWVPGRDALTATPADPHTLARDLGRFVAALQRIELPDAPLPADDAYGRGVPLDRRDAAVRHAIAQLQDEPFDRGLLHHAWHSAVNAPAWSGAPVWFHGDLLPGNVITASGRLQAVIDFVLGVGDPACDTMAAWTVVPRSTRDLFRAELQVDDATWARGRGWALSVALIALPYYRDTNPTIAALSRRIIGEVLADPL